MGLGNYLYKKRYIVATDPTHLGRIIGKQEEKLHYWRKHWALHEWMKQLYLNKGLKLDDRGFNCVNVVLTSEDLDALEDSRLVEDMPTLLEDARIAIEEGYTVYYYTVAVGESL